MTFNSYFFSNIGGRDENQDTVAVSETKNCALYIAADGLGGHMGGKEASQSVVNSLLNAWKPAEVTENTEELKQWLFCQIELAQESVLELQENEQKSMKSTVVALVIVGNTAVWANTGDSRLYHLRGGQIAGITEDHSVAYKKFKSGEITRAQINKDGDQSSLLKALGNPEKWEPDIQGCKIVPGDSFLLCTDGVWEYLYDNEILIDELKSETAEEWAQLLLLRVIDRVGLNNDNLSLVTVSIK